MNKENTLYGIIGLLLGLIVGYVGTNSLNQSGQKAPAALSSANPASEVASGDASPLPANHPPAGGAAGSGDGGQGDVMAVITQARNDPSDFDAQMKAADLFRQIGRNDGALEFYNRALKVKPNEFELLVGLGDTNMNLEKFAEAESWYQQALKAKPRHEQVLSSLTQAQIGKDDKTAAATTLKQLEQVNSKNPNLAQLRALLQK